MRKLQQDVHQRALQRVSARDGVLIGSLVSSSPHATARDSQRPRSIQWPRAAELKGPGMRPLRVIAAGRPRETAGRPVDGLAHWPRLMKRWLVHGPAWGPWGRRSGEVAEMVRIYGGIRDDGVFVWTSEVGVIVWRWGSCPPHRSSLVAHARGLGTCVQLMPRDDTLTASIPAREQMCSPPSFPRDTCHHLPSHLSDANQRASKRATLCLSRPRTLHHKPICTIPSRSLTATGMARRQGDIPDRLHPQRL